MGCWGSWRKVRYLPSCNIRSLCMIFLFPYNIESFCFYSRWRLLGQIVYWREWKAFSFLRTSRIGHIAPLSDMLFWLKELEKPTLFGDRNVEPTLLLSRRCVRIPLYEKYVGLEIPMQPFWENVFYQTGYQRYQFTLAPKVLKHVITYQSENEMMRWSWLRGQMSTRICFAFLVTARQHRA